MWNEVYVCATCHALIHAGLLIVAGERREGAASSRFSASPENPERPALEGCPLDDGERADALKSLGALGTSAAEARRVGE